MVPLMSIELPIEWGHGVAAAKGASGQRLPGRRAPEAMPRPLTGGREASPLPSEGLSSTVGALGSSVAGGVDGAGAASAAGAAAGAAFLAPGRRAVPARPSPLTGTAGAGGA